jgi:hypothetical protein
MIYDTSLYEKRKINHLKILVMSCSCGQIFFFYEEIRISQFFLSFLINRLIQNSHTFKKLEDTIVYIERRYLIVQYVGESSNLSFTLFTQRESTIVENPLL